MPIRARYIRSIMLELERIHSHLLWLGIAGHIIGFDTVLMQSWRIREPVMWLCEEITGNRKSFGMNLIGGVRRDIKREQYPKILDVVGRIEDESVKLIDAIAGDTTLHLRLQGVGVLTREDARRLCVVGPTARGSGVAIDARVTHPYAAYAELKPKIKTHTEGDCWARVLVRLEELLESIDLVRRGLQQMPAGELMADVKDIEPWQQGISVVEAPRGEDVHYVMTSPDNRPYRWRVRAPTYTNLQAIPTMIQGATIADVPIILGSIDPCFSCTERVEVVDVKSKQVRVYSNEELLEMSERATEKRD